MSNAQDKLTFKTDEVILAKIIRITKSKITSTRSILTLQVRSMKLTKRQLKL